MPTGGSEGVHGWREITDRQLSDEGWRSLAVVVVTLQHKVNLNYFKPWFCLHLNHGYRRQMGHIILSFVDLKILRGSRKRGMRFSQKKELACQFVIILERDEITFHQERKSTFQKKLNLSLSFSPFFQKSRD